MNDPQKLNQFFKSHAKKDSWLLVKEALPIMQGIDPTEADSVGIWGLSWYRDARDLALSAGNNKTLNIINPQEKSKEWRAAPKDFAKWVNEKEIQSHSAFLKYLLPKAKQATKSIHRNSEINAQKREEILNAALASVIAFPEECQVGGNFAATAIVRTIENHSKIWFQYDELPLTKDTMERLISKALKSVQK